MALLKEFRAPQPQAHYRYPGFADNSGLPHGWVIPNNGLPTLLYINKQILAGATAGAVPVVPLVGTVVYPARIGKRRAVIAWQQPAIPP